MNKQKIYLLGLIIILAVSLLSVVVLATQHYDPTDPTSPWWDPPEPRILLGPPPAIAASHSPVAPTDRDNVEVKVAVDLKAQQVDEKKCISFLLFFQKCSPTGRKTWVPTTWVPSIIEIYIDDELKKSCSFGLSAAAYDPYSPNPPVITCTHADKYLAGTIHSYYGIAKRFAFPFPIPEGQPSLYYNEVKSPTKLFIVTKAGGCPPEPPKPVCPSADSRLKPIYDVNGCVVEWECVTNVTVCLAVYAPVCGFDNKTYGNACEAQRAGIGIACQGECPCVSTPFNVMTPKAGDVWIKGNAYNIEWSVPSIVPQSVQQFTFIDIWLAAPSNPNFRYIGREVLSALKYTWIVPLDVGAGSYYISMKVVVGKGDAISASFTIKDVSGPAPQISSLQPNSGPVGTLVTIIGSGFTETGNTVKVGAGYIRNLNSLNNTIEFVVPDGLGICNPYSLAPCPLIGAYPPVRPGEYLVSVINVNGQSNSVVFTVTSVNVTQDIVITSPKKGDKWAVGNEYTIRWDVVSNISESDTELLLLGEGGSELFIGTAKLTAGQYLWPVPEIEPGRYHILLQLVGGNKSALSEPFEILAERKGICGDCDTTTNTGVLFEIKEKNISILNLFVCSVNVTENECRISAETGIDKPLICEAFISNSCSAKCFNIRGKYYVLVDGFTGLFDSVSVKDPAVGGYTYQCPELQVDKLLRIKDNLLNLQKKIKILIIKVEILNATAPDNATQAKWEKVLTTLKEISQMIDEHIAYLDTVIADPTPDAVDKALRRTQELKEKIIEKLRSITG